MLEDYERARLEGRTAYARELAALLKLKRPLVAFDVETTGPTPERDRIVQVGWVKVMPGGEVAERELDVNPDCDISAEVSAIHGITNDRAGRAPRFAELAPELREVFRDSDFCGYNVSFDVRFIVEEFKRCGMTLVADDHLLADTYKIYAAKNPRDLTSAVKHYLGEELANAHQALADARASLRLLHAELARHEDLPRSIEELDFTFFKAAPAGYVDPDKKLSLRDGKPTINFGKQWNGKALSAVDRGYLEWMLAADFNGAVKRAIREELSERAARRR